MDTNNTNQPVSTAPPSTPSTSTPPEPQPVGIIAEVPSISPAPEAPVVAGATPAATTPPAPNSSPKKGKSMMWVIILLVFAFLCGLGIVAWYFQSQFQKVAPTKQPTPTPVTTTIKKLIIGTDATFQPMEYTASGEAKIIGYDIDLGNRIGQELGATVEFTNIPWDDIFKALGDKKIDMIMSSVTITDERKQTYDFSDDYLNSGQVVITRKEDTSITSAETLQGKKIAVQQGTTLEKEAVKHTAENLVIRYPDFEQATKALVDGKADAILSDLPAAKGIVTENPTLKIASDPFTNEYYGIVFRKGDKNVQKINEVLSSLRTKGVLTDLKQKWLD